MDIFGRLHPLLVHLPIGILLLAFGLECFARWRGRQDLQAAIRLSVAAGAASALLTAVTGWLLSRQGGYDDLLLQRHQWAGFGAAGLAALVWWGQARRWYFPVFAAAVAVLTVAGHFGGSLTHGANYLFERKTTDTAGDRAAPLVFHPDSTVFAGLIQPVLKQKCQSCHNASKMKGKLRLDTAEGIRKGGEHGAIIEAGHPEKSALLRRLHLPLADDDHMPPAGKPQLSAPEIRLIEWWVAQGADFGVRQNAAALPADLEAVLKATPEAPQNPVFALHVDAASPADLKQLRDLFLSVRTITAAQPWLAVSFAGQNHPVQAHWEALRRVNQQLVDLDLAFTDTQSAAWPEMPHLIRLNLAHTPTTNALAPALQRMPYLESLNLTGTAVTDTLLATLARLPQLRRLYLWETAITPAALQQFQTQHPQVRIETGAFSVSDSTRLALRAPKILYGRSFFQDTMEVALEFPSFKGVSLYYTLDEAASPTTQSPVYHNKLVLEKTAHVRAFAAKDGWLNSPVSDALFVKNAFVPLNATLAHPPSPQYPAKGAASLIDGKIATEQGADTWLGYQGEHLTATLDLGRADTVRRVYVHCLENNAPWIFKPAAIQVATSMDGKTFRPAGNAQFAANTAMGELKTHLLPCDLKQATPARYLRVEVKSLLKNPPWHPSKGEKCWIFVDELVVE